MTTGDAVRDVAPQGDPEAGDVLAAVAGQDPDGSPAALWAALADALAGATETTTTDAAAAPQATDAPDGSDPPESTAEPVASAGGTGSTRSGVAEGLSATTEMIQRFIDEGLLRVVVVDLGGIRRPDAAPASTESPLRAAVEAIAAKDPAADIRYLGPAGGDDGSLETVAELVGGSGTATPGQVTGAIERAFGGDPGLLVRFMGTLREALPADAAIVLRGSAVSGHSYTTAEPFDGAGPGTSDLDIVVIGPGAIDLYDPEARLFRGVNTLPLSDHDPWAAPALDPARRQCQEMVGRPVNIQVMARWFLDLRAAVQGQPYVDLFVPAE
jgi:hypothetical protein